MIRKIIKIDEDRCDGCGICVSACHENAIDIIDGKAKLARENFCDGLGDCLPACPQDAMSFEEREAPAFDPEAVAKAQKKSGAMIVEGCAGRGFMKISSDEPCDVEGERKHEKIVSKLEQWPVQIRLLPEKMEIYEGRDILIAADCTAYAYANVHSEFMRGKITMIGCPKLDDGDYEEKFSNIFKENNVKSVTVLRMEVPCCAGIQMAAERAIVESGKSIPISVVTISRDGKILK